MTIKKQSRTVPGRKKYVNEEDYAQNIQFYVSGPDAKLLGGVVKVKQIAEDAVQQAVIKKRRT